MKKINFLVMFDCFLDHLLHTTNKPHKNTLLNQVNIYGKYLFYFMSDVFILLHICCHVQTNKGKLNQIEDNNVQGYKCLEYNTLNNICLLVGSYVMHSKIIAYTRNVHLYFLLLIYYENVRKI